MFNIPVIEDETQLDNDIAFHDIESELRFYSNIILNSQSPSKINTYYINKKDLEIFFSLEDAYNYEQGKGIWANSQSSILVANSYSKTCEDI